MKYYRIANRISHETGVTHAPSSQEACQVLGWMIGDCHIQELKETDGRVYEAFEKRHNAKRKALEDYTRSTSKAWERYDTAWKPLKEKWEKASGPAFKKFQRAEVQAEKDYEDEILRITRPRRAQGEENIRPGGHTE